MHDDFRVGLAPEYEALAFKLVAQRRVVFDNAVVDDGKFAVVSVGAPCVAQRVWPMPEVPGSSVPFCVFSASASIWPDALIICSAPSFCTAMPALSYPRYSSLRSPSRSSGAAACEPVNPTIPHIKEYPPK